MNPLSEWLETDGRGGFASGTVAGVRTRRYHALLLHATRPPTGRFVLVNGFEASIDTAGQSFALSTQRYAPDVTYPDGERRIVDFTTEPWPRWRYRLDNGIELEHQLFVPRGVAAVVLSWRLLEPLHDARLRIRPLLSGRDTHGTHHENGSFRFDSDIRDERVAWAPYDGLPGIASLANGSFKADSVWYRNFQYDAERERGLDFLEDLASPGEFTFDLAKGEAVLILGADTSEFRQTIGLTSATACVDELRDLELKRRRSFTSPLHRAADQYVVQRGDGSSIIAGYPWFSDWGRDTFIAIRGLLIATGRLVEAKRVLVAWARLVSQGMLPNYFPEQGQEQEYNSVDASLWFIIAVHELRTALKASHGVLERGTEALLESAVQAILRGYAAGTRFGIRMDSDSLLAAGEAGVQLTWMDARVDGHEITPRIGKPVEVQALWINALRIGAATNPRWISVYRDARKAFRGRFWDEANQRLFDVVDVDHQPGVNDATLRPNQILAIGGLPFPAFDATGSRARAIVDAVESQLYTPLGLRSLAPSDPHYTGRYGGGVAQRDGAYHQGTVWPWLLGPFVDAWVNVRGGTIDARHEAYARFLAPLLDHLSEAGLGHVSEVADGDAPHRPGGCPFQAWSIGEALRLLHTTLSLPEPEPVPV